MLEPGKPTLSSRCCGSQCVEVTALPDVVRVRDTKPGGGSIVIGTDAWRLFAEAVGRGEFGE